MKPRATDNFLIHGGGKYPICFRSVLRPKREERASRLRGSTGGTTSREPLVLPQKKNRRSRGEYTLYTTKSTRSEGRGRGAREGSGQARKKAIGKIRRNCASVDTPAPSKLEIARIPMCKAAKAWAHGRIAPSELLSRRPR